MVLSFNHPELTLRCVLSARRAAPLSRILLVHNGSESRFVRSLQKDLPFVDQLVIPENQGYSGGVNAGLKLAFNASEWVLLLTNDCELQKFSQPTPLQNRIGIWAPQIEVRKTSRIDSLGGAFDPIRLQLTHCRSAAEWVNLPQPKWRYAPGTALWLHRQVFQETGGLETEFGTYWEDVDFSIRAQAMNWQIGLAPETVIHHGVGKTCQKHAHYTSWLYWRNQYLFCHKHTAPLRLARKAAGLFRLNRWLDWRLQWRLQQVRRGLRLAWRLDLPRLRYWLQVWQYPSQARNQLRQDIRTGSLTPQARNVTAVP